MVDAELVGAPEERSRTLPHSITVMATIDLAHTWGFYAIEQDDERAEQHRYALMKVLFEYGKRHVANKLRETGTLESKEMLALNTSVAEVPCLFDPVRVKGPEDFSIEVDIDLPAEQKYSGEPSVTNISGGASINSANDTSVGGDVVGRDKVSSTTNINVNVISQEKATPTERTYLIGEQLGIVRAEVGLKSSEFIELIDFHSEQQYLEMEANKTGCPESVISRIYEATGVLPEWLKNPDRPKYEVELTDDWTSQPRETARRISEASAGEVYVTIAASIPAKDLLFWRGKNLWASITGDYLHVGVCVPISEYRYKIFDTGLSVDFRNALDSEKYAPPFCLFLSELFECFDVRCVGVILADYKAERALYKGYAYPRTVLSSPKAFWGINWVQHVLAAEDESGPTYIKRDCGGWIEDVRRMCLELG